MFNGALLTVATGWWCEKGTDWGNRIPVLTLEVFFVSGLEDDVAAIIMFEVAGASETVSLTLRPANNDDAASVEEVSCRRVGVAALTSLKDDNQLTLTVSKIIMS